MSVSVYACRGCPMEPREKKWKGPCPSCGGYWSIITLRGSDREFPGGLRAATTEGEVVSLCDAQEDVAEITRFEIGGRLSAIDELLGEGKESPGLTPGSVILIAGPPGIGKSTLALQILQRLATRMLVLYVSIEENTRQVAARSKRLGKFHQRLKVVHEKDLDLILEKIDEVKPKVVVVDSAQKISCEDENGNTLSVGSTHSVKNAMAIISDHAKRESITYIIVGHITGDGSIAGGKSGLEHQVDTVTYFAGEKSRKERRFTCSEKNRFGYTSGSTATVRLNMEKEGLVVVENPVVEEDPFDNEGDTDPDGEIRPPARESFVNPSPPRLRSVPIDPAVTWVSADGVAGAAVLAVACDVEECKGKVDRACTSSSGVREAGFHQSRVTKAKLKLEDAPKVEEEPEILPPDPFAKKFGAKPRVVAAKKKIAPKRRPKKTPPEPSPAA